MLLLTYFNPIIGPDLLYSKPENLEEIVSEDDIAQIKRLMDTATPGFFTHAFSAEINTANFFFMLPSSWARGKQEMVMVTKIIEEENPNLTSYALEFKKFVRKLKKKSPNIFKSLYINNPPLNYEQEIKKEFNYLKTEFDKLSKFFSITEAQTHGILLSFKMLRKRKSLHLPSSIIKELELFLRKQNNYFVVFQKRKDNFKIDVIPYNEEKVIKIAVIFDGQLSPETLKKISLVFQEIELPYVYTSGICQQGGKCIYEVYLNPLKITGFEDVLATLKNIPNVFDVKLIEIDLMEEE